MTVQTTSYYDIVAKLPSDTVVTFHGVGWQDYEDLLEQVGEASGLRISFDNGTLTVMTLSTEHEKYARFLEGLMTTIRLRQRINILSFGSATIRKRKKGKGNEPDACFYVQRAEALGNRIHLDFEVDPPPDIAVEIDLHHDSSSKLSISAALGVPEIWRYDGEHLTISVLQQDRYLAVPQSQALPFLTGEILTQFLTRLRTDGDLHALLAFDQWIQSQQL